jgi:hypothetical protein
MIEHKVIMIQNRILSPVAELERLLAQGWEIRHSTGGVFVLARLDTDLNIGRFISPEVLQEIPNFFEDDDLGHLAKNIYLGIATTSKSREEQRKDPLTLQDVQDIFEGLIEINKSL